MTFATYAPRSPVGIGRGNTTRRPMPPLWLVVHTSEQSGEGIASAEQLASFIATRASGGNVASYHDITDTNRIIPLVRPDYRAHAAGGGNVEGLHVCIPGKAAQTRAQWFDTITGQFLEQCARYLADKSTLYGIPLVKLTPAQVATRRVKGVCGHHDVTLAFRQSTHTDPGPNFPWDWVIDRARQLVAGTPTPTPTPTPTYPPTEGDEFVFIACYADTYWYFVKADLSGKRPTTPEDAYMCISGGSHKRNDLTDARLEKIPEY